MWKMASGPFSTNGRFIVLSKLGVCMMNKFGEIQKLLLNLGLADNIEHYIRYVRLWLNAGRNSWLRSYLPTDGKSPIGHTRSSEFGTSGFPKSFPKKSSHKR